MVSGTLALLKYLVIYMNVKQGSGPNRGRGPVERREILFVHPPSLRPEPGPGRPKPGLNGSSQALGGPIQAIEGSSQALGGQSQALEGLNQAQGGSSQAQKDPDQALGGPS